MPDRLLTIGAFARRSRLSAKALRLYDRLGLLPPAHVDDANGYRRYDESQLADARLIALLRRLDMPLAEIAEVLAAPGPAGARLLAGYWAQVETRIAHQRELAAYLRRRMDGEPVPDFTVHVRDVPEQVVLTEQRRVRVPELVDFIGSASERLYRHAEKLGGPAGPSFVIYHGQVDEDSDGPVEICLPVGVPLAEAGPGARLEPARVEAYTRIRKAQTAFPQILGAYEAVERWLDERGHEMTASPREVYFTDFAAAAADNDACDVAFPFAT
ncbi:MerR family transcriptional regulator [Hamadaea tsunoensis]|uniref:MerR family transcriptional regulator n=1 Tax=Hamadaea tsunoensis TaxID=53368 RepID=UPI000427EFC7|nr:helix-turn-helix domain-containing protein [Hamadaea tsunoensis]